MKKLFVLCLFLVTFGVKGQDLMNLEPTGYINDYENIFTPEQKADLEKICSDYEKKTTIEICLVTSADFNLDKDVDLANKWGVGKDNLDNGLMIILSKAQRDCSIRTGYGLEPFLPDGKLKEFTNDIYPRTLSQDKFYEGMKELILTCQKYIGDEGFYFKVRFKQIQDEYEAGMRKVYWFRFLQFVLLLIGLGGIGLLIFLYWKKKRDFRILKSEILQLMKDIEILKEKLIQKLGQLPTNLQNLYDSKIRNLTDSLVTRETKLKTMQIYNNLLDHQKMINTIDSTIVTLKSSETEIQKYLQNNYEYCEKYLKVELKSMLPDNFNTIINENEYSRERMMSLVGLQGVLDNKLKSFLNKTAQIDNLVKDSKSVDSKVTELKDKYKQYVEKKTILSGSKIGKRFGSLVNLDFNTYLSNLQTDITNSFSFLENGDFEKANSSYGSYIAILAVITGAFVAVDTLLSQYNKSELYINQNKDAMKDLLDKIENKIHKSGVSYTRKSTLEENKKYIEKYKTLLSTDVIAAAELLKVIVDNLDKLLDKIKSDISSAEAATASAALAASRNSYSSRGGNSGGFGGFGGGSFGGGGVRSKF